MLANKSKQKRIKESIEMLAKESRQRLVKGLRTLFSKNQDNDLSND